MNLVPARPAEIVAFAWTVSAGLASAAETCTSLSLEVDRIVRPPTAYAEFCAANPADCGLTGRAVLAATDANLALVRAVNRAVNAEVTFLSDLECRGTEEAWSYPLAGRGDCEDNALEKRRRLVESGVPRGATTMAIGYHRTELFIHAVLLLETTRGTYVLDSLSDDLTCWDRAPYHFEARERPDGLWERFDQTGWWKEQP